MLSDLLQDLLSLLDRDRNQHQIGAGQRARCIGRDFIDDLELDRTRQVGTLRRPDVHLVPRYGRSRPLTLRTRTTSTASPSMSWDCPGRIEFLCTVSQLYLSPLAGRFSLSVVMAGLVPAIPMRKALTWPNPTSTSSQADRVERSM